MLMTTVTDVRRLLEVYVAPHCFGCETAREVVARVIQLGIAGLEVRLIDLGAPDALRPAAVFAVPTYLLDGRVLSLGNPEYSWLISRLTGGPSESEHGGDRSR